MQKEPHKVVFEAEISEHPEVWADEFSGAQMVVMRQDEYSHWLNMLMILMFTIATIAAGFGVFIGYAVWGR